MQQTIDIQNIHIIYAISDIIRANGGASGVSKDNSP